MRTKGSGVAKLLFVTLLLGAFAYVQATPITGTVNITGSAGVTATYIDFFGNPAAGCSQAAPGTPGCFLANVPLTGSFSNLTPGVIGGTIKDLQGPPISGNISLASFLSFSNGVVFDLTRVVPGGAPDCASVNTSAANVQCTPTINGQVSPFVMTNSSDGTNASVFFNVQVLGYTGTAATGTTLYVGAFNTPSAGANISAILATIASGGTVAAAYSANFRPVATEIPEPETITLLGLGLFAIAVGGRWRRRSA